MSGVGVMHAVAAENEAWNRARERRADEADLAPGGARGKGNPKTTNDEILKRLRDIAADRLAFLAQAIELAQNLTGPDDPKLEQLRNLIRS